MIGASGLTVVAGGQAHLVGPEDFAQREELLDQRFDGRGVVGAPPRARAKAIAPVATNDWSEPVGVARITWSFLEASSSSASASVRVQRNAASGGPRLELVCAAGSVH